AKQLSKAPRLPVALGRARYAAAQGARVAWYMGQYYLARGLSTPVNRPGEPEYKPANPPGNANRIWEAFLELFAKDRANIEAGLYAAPGEVNVTRALSALTNSAKFFSDLPDVDARRIARRGVEVRESNAPRGRYPTYYLQNFHYQTGGWLTKESEAIYDTQVEVLFGGAAAAMRRIALGSLLRGLKGRDQRKSAHLDIGCGNGLFLKSILEARPKLHATGLDLSPIYVNAARERLSPWPQADVVTGAAESAPFADASFESASAIYLFHELPPRVRRDVARELARLVKPGGVFVLGDSVQWDDLPDFNQMLEYFPHGFHEPYFASYADEDLEALFLEAGFALEETELAFLTKVMRFRRV
ncbi:MAG: class I SAM-dependent methyltransferase, partial [Caulobacterales bacterium]